MDGRMTARAARAATAITLAALLLAACGKGGSTAGSAAPAAGSASVTASSSPSTPASSTPSSSPSSSPAVASGVEKLADGSSRVTDAVVKFQLVVPRGYVRITDKKQLDEIVQAGRKALKNRSSELDAAAFQKNVKLFAINKLTGATISLATAEAAGMTGADLVDQADQIHAVLSERLGAKAVSTQPITVDGEPALRADGTVTSPAGEKFQLSQIYAVSHDRVFILTIGGANTPEKVVLAEIAGLHFLP